MGIKRQELNLQDLFSKTDVDLLITKIRTNFTPSTMTSFCYFYGYFFPFIFFTTIHFTRQSFTGTTKHRPIKPNTKHTSASVVENTHNLEKLFSDNYSQIFLLRFLYKFPTHVSSCRWRCRCPGTNAYL